ncbi:MAG TPA: response regulator, partial [Thermoanaerobaculia bacterium]|nr:response regulator [Thermoanaerobaculia bacterium]
DGYALIRRVHELGREVPAMALTGYGRPEDKARILASGFQQYVQKPVNPSELAKAVAAMVRT